MTTSTGVISSPDYGVEESQLEELGRNNAYDRMLNEQLASLGIERPPAYPGTPGGSQWFYWRNPGEKEQLLQNLYPVREVSKVLSQNVMGYEPFSGQWNTWALEQYQRALPHLSNIYKMFEPSYLSSGWDIPGREHPGNSWWENWLPSGLQKILSPFTKLGGLIAKGPKPWDIWQPNEQPPAFPWT